MRSVDAPVAMDEGRRWVALEEVWKGSHGIGKRCMAREGRDES